MLNKQSFALQKQINRALEALRNNGTLSRLSHKYFQVDMTKK